MSDTPLLIATRSEGKLRELLPLFAAEGFVAYTLEDVGIAPDVREDGLEVHDTFLANARAKAEWFFAFGGLPVVVAEDSGLVVDALDGAPGVLSKRWSGRTDLVGAALDQVNNERLLSELEAIGAWSMSLRTARYVCAAVAMTSSGAVSAVGETAGVMTHGALGDNGFGYDPYFFSIELGKTFGQASREEKEGVSHRGRAFRALLRSLKQIQP